MIYWPEKREDSGPGKTQMSREEQQWQDQVSEMIKVMVDNRGAGQKELWLYVSWWSVSLMTNDVEHFMYLLDIHRYSLMKYLFKHFARF